MRFRLAPLALAALLATGAHAVEVAPPCLFGPGDLPTTTNPGGLHGAQIPVDTIVVLMQENRSFDHYFGHLPGQKRVPNAVAQNPDPLGGGPIKTFHQQQLCETADLDHSWNGTHHEWNGGAMDGFTAANVDPTDPTGRRAMGYYTARDLPYYYKLYKTFAMSDRHFCSVLSQTFPNRYFLLAGTAFGEIGNTIPDLGSDLYAQRTIFNLLDEAGVTWSIYFTDLPFGAIFSYVRKQRAENLKSIDEYFTDAAAGRLPQVAFVDPGFLIEETANDEHPPRNVQIGQEFVARIIDTLMRSPQWSRSALFLTYDEHGGFWDHVPPPLACVPDDIPPKLKPHDVPGAYDRYGIRVPFVVVSPFAKRRYLSHTVTDQTSVLRFIQTRFDLPALTRRDANADALLEMFDFEHPPFLAPPRLPTPFIDPVKRLACP